MSISEIVVSDSEKINGQDNRFRNCFLRIGIAPDLPILFVSHAHKDFEEGKLRGDL